MAESGPSKSRILAALDLTEDSPSLPPSLPAELLARQAGAKRKRGAAYAVASVAPLNKRQAYGTSRAAINRLPPGLLANTQSPGPYLLFLFLFFVHNIDACSGLVMSTARCRGNRRDAHTRGSLCH